MDPYALLGVTKDATEKDIKDAWRRKSSENHPDREGGDNVSQADINVARDILLDPVRRAAIDNGKAAPPPDLLHKQAKEIVVQWASCLVIDEEKRHQPLMVLLREGLMNARLANQIPIMEMEKDISLLKKRLEETKDYSVESEDNLFCAVIERMIDEADKQLQTTRLQFDVLDEIERILNGYTTTGEINGT